MKKFFLSFVASVMLLCATSTAFAIQSPEVGVWNGGESRTSYNTWYSFRDILRTQSRDFDGNNLCFLSNNAQNDLPPGYIQYAQLEVTLYRGDSKNRWGNQKMGTTTVPMVGRWYAKWHNVGPGKYFFEVKKKDNMWPDARIFDHSVTLTNDC